ncbi:MAG: hypothetical protein LBP51_02085, partial [Deferribacteraceae bacterium]|nr:hypothetical protein [Deferribacteraceae bacterium]
MGNNVRHCLLLVLVFSLFSCGVEDSKWDYTNSNGGSLSIRALLESFGSCGNQTSLLARKLSEIISSDVEGVRAVNLEQDYLNAYFELYQCDKNNADKWEKEIRAKSLNSRANSLKYINFLKSIQGAVFIVKSGDGEDGFQTHVRYINDIYDSAEDSFKDLLAIKDEIVSSKFEDGFDNDSLVFSLVFNAVSSYWDTVFSMMDSFEAHTSISDSEAVWEGMWAAYLFLDNETLKKHISPSNSALQSELALNLRVNLVYNAVEYFNKVGVSALANAKAVYETDISNAFRVLTLTHRSGKALYDKIVEGYEGLCFLQEVHTGSFGAGREALYLGISNDPIYIRPYQEGRAHNL